MRALLPRLAVALLLALTAGTPALCEDTRGLVRSAPAQAAGPELRALVAGVNDYPNERSLRGAVNDARSVAAALRPLARHLELRLDRDVTSATLLGLWRALLAESARGDTLLVAFSGHGGREWVGVSPEHPRGIRDFWVMSDYDSRTEDGRRQRIEAPEIERLVGEANAAGVQTLIVADHCFAGAAFRSLGVDVRNLRSLPIRSAPGAPPMPANLPELSKSVAVAVPPGLTWLGAAPSFSPVSEFIIQPEGRIHGALSYAFARGLTEDRDRLDPTHSGVVRRGELMAYLKALVGGLSDDQQSAELRPFDHPDQVLFRLAAPGAPAGPVPVVPPPPAPPQPVAAGRVPVYVAGPREAAQALIAGIADAVWEDDPTRARLSWLTDGQPRLVNGLHMFVTFDPPSAEGLAAAVATTRVTDALVLEAARGDLKVSHARPGGGPEAVYFAGDDVELTVAGPPGRYLAVFNLTWNGLVQFLFPLDKDVMDKAGAIDWPASGKLIGGTTVARPFGEDHVIAVASPRPLDGLLAALHRFDDDGRHGSARAAEAGQAIRAALQQEPQARVGLASVFSVPRDMQCDPQVIRNADMLAACRKR